MHRRLSTRPTAWFVAGLLALFAAFAARAGTFNLKSMVAFDIPSQPLETALLQLSKQASCQLAISAASLPASAAPSVNGTMSIRTAVEMLLTNTDLSYKLLGDRTLTILPGARTSTSDSAETASTQIARVVGDFRPAQLRLATAAADDVAQAPQTAAAPPADAAQTTEMVITGSRLKNSGTDKGPAPVVTFDRERLDQLGITRVADVLNYIPQQPFQVTEGDTFAGSRPVQLRGLGLGTTLVLINGRRTIPSALQGARAYFDLNMLPLSAVERIEILPDSAAAVYGTDAIGGVLNIILKDRIASPTVDLQYGSAQGGSQERQASVTFGPAGERFGTLIALDYLKREALFGADRDLAANADYRRFGGLDQRRTQAYPGNVCAVSGNLPGLTTPCAAIPQTAPGTTLTPASFAATAGTSNYYNYYTDFSLDTPIERKTVTAIGHYDFMPTLRGFGELLFSRKDDTRVSPPSSLTNALVPANNPHNPFQVPVRVSYSFDGIGKRYEAASTDSWRAVAGLGGDRGRWDWEVSTLFTRERSTNDAFAGTVDAAKVTPALNATDPALALNLFQGPGGSPALLNSLLYTLPKDSLESKGIQSGAFVRGSLWRLPAGSLDALLGAEVRQEELMFASFSSVLFMTADRKSSSAFYELRAPLFKQMSLVTSGRYDEYDDIGGTFNPQFGLTWTPAESLLVRASWGTGYRAPSLFELYQPISTTTFAITDPRRNNLSTDVAVTSGGDTGLKPEESESYTVGFVLTPQWLRGFEFSAAYWSVEQEQRVVRTSTSTILQNELYFPERVTRAAPNAADIAAGRPGQLLTLRSTNLNAGSLETRGLDLEASYTFQTSIGRFKPSLSATWVDTFTAADFPTTPIFERVGLAQSRSTIPEWRAVGSLAWGFRAVNLTATGRYFAPYDDATAGGVRNGRIIHPPILLDLQGSVDVGALVSSPNSWAQDLNLRAGALNFTDEMPEYAEIGGLRGYDQSSGDLRGRVYYVKLSKSF